jgi:large repetitive protein
LGCRNAGQILVQNGTPPYTFAVNSGPLPAGLALNQSTGAITGLPTLVGAFPFTIGVTDFNGISGSKALTISITGVVLQMTPTSVNAAPKLGDAAPTASFHLNIPKDRI